MLADKRRTCWARGLFSAVIALTLLVASSPQARAACALIPTAIKKLRSVDGNPATPDGLIDRPFAVPGDLVTIFADDACELALENPFFSTNAAENEITIVFEPPVDPSLVPAIDPPLSFSYPAFSAESVSDCGEDQCFAVSFRIPDTSGLIPMSTSEEALTGPVTIQVRNNAESGNPVVAQVGELFEPNIGCSETNQFRSPFVKFTVLPPLNAFTGATSDLRAALDGSRSLLIPMDYTGVLPAGQPASATARLLAVSCPFCPNGLPGGGMLVLDRTTEPDDFDFVRAFSRQGGSIPPILKVNNAGTKIVGSVDWTNTVLRIARRGPPGPDKFNLVSAMVGGFGPVILASVELSARGVAPLSSLRATRRAIAIARDEALESQFGTGDQNGDSDQSDRVVELLDIDSGIPFNTGLAVVESRRTTRKAVINTEENLAAFLQSEAHQGRDDINLDGSADDGIVRVFQTDGTEVGVYGGDGGTPSAGAAGFFIEAEGGPSPVVISDGILFFARNEAEEAPLDTVAHLDPGTHDNPSQRPALSGDGTQVAFSTSTSVVSPGLVAPVELIWERTTLTGSNNPTLIPNGTGTWTFDAGHDDVPNLDYSSAGAGQWEVTSIGNPDDESGTHFFVEGSFAIPDLLPTPTFRSDLPPLPVDPLNPTGGEATILAIQPLFGSETPPGCLASGACDQTVFVSTGPWDTITTNPPLPAFPADRLLNPRFVTTTLVVPGSQTDIGGGFVGFDLTGTSELIADVVVTGQQVYLSDLDTSAVELVSANANGAPSDCASDFPSLSDDADVVAFLSCASNLVPGPGGSSGDQVFVVKRGAGTIVRASEALGGGESNNLARSPAVSADGSTVAYLSPASNLVGGVAGTPIYEVYAYDVASGTNQLVSRDLSDQYSGGAFYPGLGVSSDGSEIAFASTAPDLVAGDTNGIVDVFVGAPGGPLERVSVGPVGVQADGASLSPSMSDDGRFVAFESTATNLVADVGLTGSTSQCFLRDRVRGTTQLVSATLGGAPANGNCTMPKVSGNGRYVAFVASASNLTGSSGISRVYRFDRLTAVVTEYSVDETGLTSATLPSGTMGIDIDREGHAVAFTSQDTGLAPATPSAREIFVRRADLAFAQNIDINGVAGDSTVLFSADLALGDGDAVALFVAAGAAAVAAGRVLIQTADTGPGGVIPGGFALLVDGAGGGIVAMNSAQEGGPVVDIALSAGAACTISDTHNLRVSVADLATAVPAAVPGLAGAEVQAIDDKCIVKATDDTLHVVEVPSGAVTPVNAKASDFQVATTGIAFRTCESQVGFPLNGDGDTADCVMRFYDFERAFDGDPGTDPLIDTLRTAIPCEFPGCDPFFEPYRISVAGVAPDQTTVVSFVARESDEVGPGGIQRNEEICLPSSPSDGCDLTGDFDGDDLTMQVVNLASVTPANPVPKVQVFPLRAEAPPDTPPFPMIVAEETLISIKLPVSALPTEYEEQACLGQAADCLPDDAQLTLIMHDQSDDFVFDQSGVTNEDFAAPDGCPTVSNAAQTNSDPDSLPDACDTLIDADLDQELVNLVASAAPSDPDFVNPEVPGDSLCDLNKSLTITRPEVDQVLASRGISITPPDESGAATDDRDRDPDGEITLVDFRLCLADCVDQPDGCPVEEPETGEPPPATNGFKCGLLGLEALLPIGALAWRRGRRIRRC